MIPTPTEIEHFIEIFKTQHLSRAAEHLRLSQPTLSQSLKRLEDKVARPLFIRSKTGLFPTPAGKMFFRQAQNLMGQWGVIQNSFQVAQESLSGRFRLGCHVSIAAFALPGLFRTLQQVAPDIEIELFHDFSKRINERVIRHELDLGLVMNPYRHPDLVLTPLCKDTIRFWKKKGTDPVPNVFFADASDGEIRELLGPKNSNAFSNWKVIETSSLELIRTLTLQGLGVGLLPTRVANCDQQQALVPLNTKLPELHDELFLSYRRENFASAGGRVLIEALKSLKF